MQDNFYGCALRYANSLLFKYYFEKNAYYTIGLKKYLYGIEECNLNNFLFSGCQDIKSLLFLNIIDFFKSTIGLRSRSFKINCNRK